MDIDYFIHNDYSKLQGAKMNTHERAFFGRWIEIDVYKSVNVEGTNAAGHDNTMFHRDALALVVQMEPTTHTDFDINYFAHKVAVEQLHGSKEMRDDHGVWMKGA